MRTAIAIVLLAASPALAANRYCATCKPVYHAPAVVAQPQTIIENQQVFYPVAPYAQQPITDAAVQLAQAEEIKHSMQALSDQVAAFQQRSAQPQMIVVYPQIQMQGQAMQGQAEQPPACGETACNQPAEKPAFNQTASVMASCVKCHTKAGAARDAFDLTKPISCEQALDAMEAVATGSMPKGGKPFSGEQLRKLKVELAKYNERFDKPATPPQPAEKPADQPADKSGEAPPTAPDEDDPKFSRAPDNATRQWLKFAPNGFKKKQLASVG